MQESCEQSGLQMPTIPSSACCSQYSGSLLPSTLKFARRWHCWQWRPILATGWCGESLRQPRREAEDSCDSLGWRVYTCRSWKRRYNWEVSQTSIFANLTKICILLRRRAGSYCNNWTACRTWIRQYATWHVETIIEGRALQSGREGVRHASTTYALSCYGTDRNQPWSTDVVAFSLAEDDDASHWAPFVENR